MKITTFNPMILSPKSEEVISLFEELGFERRHQKDNIDDKDISSVRMKDSNGFYVDVARVESMPQDMTTMRMNVRDFDETYEFLKDCKGFGDNSESKKLRLLLAELLVADSYGTDNAMINNVFINNALSVIKAQQIATMVTVVSNILSVALSAVADKDNTETDSSDTAQTEQQSTETVGGV